MPKDFNNVNLSKTCFLFTTFKRSYLIMDDRILDMICNLVSLSGLYIGFFWLLMFLIYS